MILPTLPTDNLYKFIALSGLIIFFISIFYPYKYTSELKLEMITVSTQSKLLKLDIDTIEQEISIIEKKKDPTKDEMKELSDRNKQTKVNSIKHQGNVERLAVLLKQLKYAAYGLIFGSIVGIIFASTGFRLWYIRVQRPLDIARNKEMLSNSTND